MNKLYTFASAIALMSLVACGPSAEEKEKMAAEEQAKVDSVFNSASQAMDSTAATPAAHDSTAAAH